MIQGLVLRGGEPVGGAYVRLLDSAGEFTAEVPTSATGHFRFFAATASWTLRTLAPGASSTGRSWRHAAGGRDRRRARSRLTRPYERTCSLSPLQDAGRRDKLSASPDLCRNGVSFLARYYGGHLCLT